MDAFEPFDMYELLDAIDWWGAENSGSGQEEVPGGAQLPELGHTAPDNTEI